MPEGYFQLVPEKRNYREERTIKLNGQNVSN